MKRLETKKLTLLSALVAVAMILSYIESLVPAFVAVPGVKIGLSNIATVFALYALGPTYAVCVSVVRVVLSALLFGNFVSLIYSLSGAALALLVMILLKRLNCFSTVGVSVSGGVMHNAGQIIAACIVMENAAISLYIIPLIISGTLSGVAIGIVAGLLVDRIKKF
ncbi:MAG: Gx transporter family protein [Clostridia bacterium]|nr:Gx transporter family protein [Clostridia bacterium]